MPPDLFVLVPVEKLKIGDWVDLQHDRYADPTGANPLLELAYQQVYHLEQETAECVAVDFEGFDTVGFPTGHQLRVVEI